jgi:hypothetical protein
VSRSQVYRVEAGLKVVYKGYSVIPWKSDGGVISEILKYQTQTINKVVQRLQSCNEQ